MAEDLPNNNANQSLQQGFEAFNEWLNVRSTLACHRQIVTLSVNTKHIFDCLQVLDKHYNQILYVGNSEFESLDNIASKIEPKQYKKMLGQQVDALIFDARMGINLNALIATIGLINHSGICLLILPESDEGNSANTSAISLSFGYQKPESWFNKKLLNVLNEQVLASISQDNWRFPPSLIIDMSENVLTEEINPSTEQQKVITFFSNNIHKKNTLIVMGARGRGKSTLLGFLHAPATEANKHVYICAPSKTHAKQFYSSCGVSDSYLQKTTSFVAPEDLDDIEEKDAVLFIDEMASIAPNFLKNVITKNMPIVMTGTNIGYEGSAKGFVQRLLPSMLSEPTSYVFTLNTPFRWYKEDPLESFTNTLLANDFECTDQKLINTTKEGHHFYLLDKSILINESNIYEQVFGLLNLSHYQTHPNDIVRMLDSPDHQIFVCADTDTNNILAVACIIVEGISDDKVLAENISKGKRRVQGQMTPQTLSYYTFSPQYCDYQYYRISRITVSTEARRQGIASQLLLTIKSYALLNGVSFLSTSFGFTSELFTFWQQNKFTLAKIGQRVDSASGTRSIMMLASVKDTSSYPKQLLNMRLLMDIKFLRVIKPHISETLEELEKHIPNTNKNDLALYAKQICLLYLDSNMNFKQLAFAIFYYATSLSSEPSNLIDLQKDTPTPLTLCLALIQKNLSKKHKIALDSELKIVLKQQINKLNDR